MTIEGAPHLREEHYAVFDCANRCGKTGKRFLAPMSHVRMMAAAQPFLSGAISQDGQPAERRHGRRRARDLRRGLEARAQGRRALPRRLQGLAAAQSSSDETRPRKKPDADEPTAVTAAVRAVGRARPVRPEGTRVRLPKKRRGFTQEARVGGHKIFLRTGEYEDGTLGEIFIDMHKEGAAFRSLMNCFAMAVSIGLQYGVPLETFVEQFTFTRFEPQGVVEGHANIKFATSIVDYIFRVLGVEYLKRYDLAHVKPAEDAVAIEDPTLPKHVPVEPPSASLLPPPLPTSEASGAHGALDAQLEEMMGDAPVCDGCGHITVRNGACYKCLNCGNSMGCS